MPVLRRALSVLKAPFVFVGKAYNDTAQKYPMYTGVVTTVIKTSAADLFAQKIVERREEVDWRRHGMFVLFGFGYLGCWQYYLYNDLFVRWCKPITALVGHRGSAPVKTFIDQCIHHPVLYFPSFYTLKGMVEGKPLSESMSEYREHLWDNCKALWMIWVPAQMVNFTVVPLHLRIPFVAGVSFAWTVVISCMRGALDKKKPAAEEDTAIMMESVVANAGAAPPIVARSSPIALQPLLFNAANASADSPQEAETSSPPGPPRPTPLSASS
ncbi:hypothetical protein VOLCADRAFT_107297 [Volvox carteri f. nagariensis]|uniref:Peroxisomal membrane protein n=1 Tax=Volvox carteri f. nagariensis TaxID=3068 RepID=D8UD29_VOLCA|nr:uncharacterized protein VOLCADRAFT_107297 [Volvox carteri f. nagariensis]EFJ42322.1 hypothetical protein VOLCADRAFT_107297 [Volvox carteri f. nagariensis]|eukprot:XP_002956555.1 hypothetical protein VOLCADRAFT_107297 [Volvox carteri f. nagariensis]